MPVELLCSAAVVEARAVLPAVRLALGRLRAVEAVRLV
jgi:hypothetical protein